MYIPKHFTQTDKQALYDLIYDYPLATVVVNTRAGISANHIPLIICRERPGLVLQGHIAAANPLWKSEISGKTLAIFQGPHAYISPSWYATKKQHGKVVPTWNYTSAHARGDLRFIDDDGWKMKFLHSLTDKQESRQPEPWSVADAPGDFTEKMLAAIVGLEIAVTELSGKWKVSQNQPEKNRAGVRDALCAGGNPDAEQLSGY